MSETAQVLLWFLTGEKFLSADEDALWTLGDLLEWLAARIETVLVGAATEFLGVVEGGVEGALGEALRDVLSAYVVGPGLFTRISMFCAEGGAVLHQVGQLVEYYKLTTIIELYQMLIGLLQLALGVGLWWQVAIFLAARKTAFAAFKSAWFTALRMIVDQVRSHTENSLFAQERQLRSGRRKVLDPSLIGGAAAVGLIGGGLGIVMHPFANFLAGPRSGAARKNLASVGTSAIHEGLTAFFASGLSGKWSFSPMALASGALSHGADLAGAKVQSGFYAPDTSFHVALARFHALLHGGGDGSGKSAMDSGVFSGADEKGLPSGRAGTDRHTDNARDHSARQRSVPEEPGKNDSPKRNEIAGTEKPVRPPMLADAPAPPAVTAPAAPSDGAAPPSGSGATSPDWSGIAGDTGDSPATAVEESSSAQGETATASTEDRSAPGDGAGASLSSASPLAQAAPPVGLGGPVGHVAGGIILTDQTLTPKELARELAYTRRALRSYAPVARAKGTIPVVLHGFGGQARLGEADRSLRKLVPELAAQLDRPEYAGLTVELVTCVTHGMSEKNAHAALRRTANGLGRDVISAISPMWIVDAGRPEGAGLWLASEIDHGQRPQWPPNGRFFRYPKDGGQPELLGTGFHNWSAEAVAKTNPADLVMRKWLAKGGAITSEHIDQLTEAYSSVVAVARAGLDIRGVRRLGKLLHKQDRRLLVLQEKMKRAELVDDTVKAAVSRLERKSLRAHRVIWEKIASLGDVPVDYLSRHGAIGGPLAKVHKFQGGAALRQWARDEALRALPELDPDTVREAVEKRLSDKALSGQVPGITGAEALFDGTGIVLQLGKGRQAAVVTINARRPSAFRLQKATNGEPAEQGSRLTKVGRTEGRQADKTTISESIAASAGFNGMSPGTPGDLFKATISGSATVGGGIRTTRSQTIGSSFEITTDVGVPAIGDLPSQAHLWHGKPDGLTLTVSTRTGVTTEHAPQAVVDEQAITVQLLNALVFAAPPAREVPGGDTVRIPPKAAVVNLRLRSGLSEKVASLLPSGLGKPGGRARSIWAPEIDSVRKNLLEITGNGRVIRGLRTKTGAHGPESGRDRLRTPVSGHLVLTGVLGTPELITDQATEKSGHSGLVTADASQAKGRTRFVRGAAGAGPTVAAGPVLAPDKPYFQGNLGFTASVDRSSGNTSGHTVTSASKVQDWNFGDHLLYRVPITLSVSARLTGAPDVAPTALSDGPTGYVTIVVTRADARAYGFPLPAQRRDTRPRTVPWVDSTTAGKDAPSVAHQPIYEDVRGFDTTGLLDFALARVRDYDRNLVPPENAPVDPPRAAKRRLAERQAENLRLLTSAIDRPWQRMPRVVELDGPAYVQVEITPQLIVPKRGTVDELRGGETEVSPGTGKEFNEESTRTLSGSRSVGTGARIGFGLALGASTGGLAGIRLAFARVAASWGWSGSRSLGGSRTLISGHTTETASEKIEWHSVSPELRWSVRVTAAKRPTAPSTMTTPIEKRTYERTMTISAPGGATLLVPGIDEKNVQQTYLAGPDESTVFLHDRHVAGRQPVNLTGPADIVRLNIPDAEIRLALETALSSAIRPSRKDRRHVNWPSPRRGLSGAGRWWPVMKTVTVRGDTGLEYEVDVSPLLYGPGGTELRKLVSRDALPGSLQPLVSGAGSARLWGGGKRNLLLVMPGMTTTLEAKLVATAKVHSPRRIHGPQKGYHLMKIRGITGGMSSTAKSDSGPDVAVTAQVTGDAGSGHKNTGQVGYSGGRRKGRGKTTFYNTAMVSLHKYTDRTVLMQVAVDITFEGTVRAKGLNLFRLAEPVATTVTGYLTVNVPEHVADALAANTDLPATAPASPAPQPKPANTDPPATLTHMPGRAVVDTVSDWHRPDGDQNKPASLELLASRMVASLGPVPSAVGKMIGERSVRDMVRDAATELLSVESIEGQTADLYNGLHRSFTEADGTVVTVTFHVDATNVGKGGVPHPAGYTIGLVNIATAGTTAIESTQHRHGGNLGDTDIADVKGPPLTGALTSGNLAVSAIETGNGQRNEGQLQMVYTEEVGAGAFIPHTVDHKYRVSVSVARGERAAEWIGDPVHVDGAVTFRVSERAAGIPGMKDKLKALGMAEPRYEDLPAKLPELPGNGVWRLPETVVPAIEGVDVGTGADGVRDALWKAFANAGATKAQLAQLHELSPTALMTIALTGKPPSTGPLSSVPGLFQRDRVGNFGWKAAFSGQPVAQNGRKIYREHLVLDLASEQAEHASRVDINGTVGETLNWGDNSMPPPPGIFTGPLLQTPMDSSAVNGSSAAQVGMIGEGDGHRTAKVELAVEYVTDLRVQFAQLPATKVTPGLEKATRPTGGPTGTLVHSGVTFLLFLSDIKKLRMFGWRERFLAATDAPALPENERARMPSTLDDVAVPAGTHLEVVDGKLKLAMGDGPAVGNILDLPSTTERAILVVDPDVPEALEREFTDRYPAEAVERA